MILAVFGAGLLGLVLIASQQRRLIYHPDRSHVLPAALGLTGVDELRLATPDGESVVAWWAKAPPGRPTVLYFHGNAGSLADRAERVRKYQAAGLGLLIMAYRGYSGSTGSPSEAANVADARLALERLLAHGVAISEIVVYGESLGSGIAAQIAADRPFAGLILDAPYTTLVELAAVRHPFLPVRQLMWDRYETANYVGRFRSPLLVVHGEKDEIIPVSMGRAVFDAAPEPKRFAVIVGAMHADHYKYGSYRVIFAWIDDVWRARTSRAGQ